VCLKFYFCFPIPKSQLGIFIIKFCISGIKIFTRRKFSDGQAQLGAISETGVLAFWTLRLFGF